MSKLYIVGTPIGNLKDITLRAIETLKEVEIIACEDSRVTRKLLDHYQITNKRLLSYHDKNEKNSATGLITLLLQGNSIALVSDAGMPLINDPGFVLVREAIQKEVEIEVIPGPSATITSVILSNFDTHFTFIGFLKPKSGQRQNQLKELGQGTFVAFVSPHQLLESLNDVKEALGANTRVFLGRELTKLYESHYRGTVAEVIAMVNDEVRGEFVLVMEIKTKKVNKYDK